MDNRAEVRGLLMSRGAGVTPEQLERGAIAGASSAVLDTIARALRPDGTERTPLFDLARLQFLGPP